MRYTISALLVAMVLGCGGKPGVKKEDGGPKDDKQMLQGVWRPVDGVYDGEKIPEPEKKFAGATAEFAGDKVVFKVNGEITEIHRMKLDPSQMPKALDLAVIDESGEVRKLADTKKQMHDCIQQCIYTFEGDLLKLCLPEGFGEPRPEKFDALPGSGLTVMTFQKVR